MLVIILERKDPNHHTNFAFITLVSMETKATHAKRLHAQSHKIHFKVLSDTNFTPLISKTRGEEASWIHMIVIMAAQSTTIYKPKGVPKLY